MVGGSSPAVRRALAVALSLGLGGAAPVVGPAEASGGAPPGQVVTVEAATGTSVHAVVRAWARRPDGRYAEVFGPVVAFIGEHGLGPTHEGAGRTPAGVYRLTQAFGNRPNPGTRLAYRLVTALDWWDEDPASPRYNEMVSSRSSPGGASENLYDAGPAYAAAVVIDYNMDPVVPGRGSGFFLHVSMGVPTEGCVAVPRADLYWIMRWLDPAKRPVISMGVGPVALAPVEARG